MVTMRRDDGRRRRRSAEATTIESAELFRLSFLAGERGTWNFDLDQTFRRRLSSRRLRHLQKRYNKSTWTAGALQVEANLKEKNLVVICSKEK